MASLDRLVDIMAREGGTASALADIATYCPAFVTQYSSDLHMLVWLLARYYRTGKVQDLNFQLPGAGAGCWRHSD